MKLIIKNIYAILFLAICPIIVTAQEDLPDDQMEFLDSYEVDIPETERLNLLPSLPDVKQNPNNQTYIIPTKLMMLSYDAPVIRPVSIKPAKLPPIYSFWGKAGFGTPLQPYALLSYRNGRSDQTNFGIEAKYHGNDNDKNYANQKHSEVGLKLDGDYYSDLGFAFGGYGGYNQDNRYYFGYDHDDPTISFTNEEVHQIVNTISAGLRFFNTERNVSDVDYDANLDFYWLQDKLDTQETGITASGSITKWFSDTHPLTIDLKNELVKMDDTVSQTINIFSINPTFLYNGDRFKAKIGANLAVNDSLRIFPDVEVSTQLLGNQLLIFAGWTGSSTAQSWRRSFAYNPYIGSYQKIRTRGENYGYAGVKGKIKVFDYEIRLGYKLIENQALFVNDPTDTKKFLVVYDDMNTFHALIKVNADVVQDFNVYASLEFNTNNTDTQEKAWHLPVFEGNIGATYRLLDNQLKFTVETYLANGVPYFDVTDGSNANLGSLFDLTFKSEYQITENFGVFLDLNNVASNKRERFFMYPSYGFNVLGGLTLRF